MKRGIIPILIILFLSFINAQGDVSKETNISVIVDEDPPIINIISPISINYINTSPIKVNFTVEDITLEETWYSFDLGKTNVSVYTTTFDLNLAEDNYTFRIYAKDAAGWENFEEVNFTVNNSLPGCGDNICDSTLGESCSICSVDCQCETSPPPNVNDNGDDGGGGGNNDRSNGGGNNNVNRPEDEDQDITPRATPIENTSNEIITNYKVIPIRENVSFVNITDGEKIILKPGNKDVSYLVEFDIEDDNIKLKVKNGDFNLDSLKVRDLLLDDLPVYIGVKNVKDGEAVLGLSLNKDNIEKEVIAENKKKNLLRMIGAGIIGALFVVFLVVLIIFLRKNY